MSADSPESPTIRPFDFRNADEREYALLNDFYDRMHAEQEPDDPPRTHEQRVRNWRSRPAFIESFSWMITDAAGAATVAVASVGWLRTGENQHAAEFEIEVLPEQRRRGLGRHLLGLITETSERASRRLLIGSTTDRVPAGAAFMERLGAHKGLESHTNQLKLTELNREAIHRWLEEARALAPEFQLGFWTGAFPEEELAAIADLQTVMNQAPRGAIELEDMRPTPQQIREGEQSLATTGTERWTAYARERATGAFAGYSAVFWNPERPWLLQQGDTGVFPQYRNRGLGRWLKAAMLQRILQERPEVQVIRTNNADSNVPMLRINTELGFRPYLARAVWQVETARVRGYLDQSGSITTR